jgi:hypothetical protein
MHQKPAVCLELLDDFGAFHAMNDTHNYTKPLASRLD